MCTSPIYKNKLQKSEIVKMFINHHTQLSQIAKKTNRYPQIDNNHRFRLYQNAKGTYLKERRQKQVNLQNRILLYKIIKIKQVKRPTSFWLKDRSHSLNQFTRKQDIKSIDSENRRMFQKIMSQKPHISFQKFSRYQVYRQKLSSSISKIEKYKLPEIGFDAQICHLNSIRSSNQGNRCKDFKLKSQQSFGEQSFKNPQQQ